MERLAEGEDLLAWLMYFSAIYAHAVQRYNTDALAHLGCALYRWLDPGDALDSWLSEGERVLEIRVDPTDRGELGSALLALPWEILHRDGAFLAEHPVQLFTVERRCAAQTAEPPRYADVRLLFMAASPEGVSELDYEGEEVAILEATRSKLGDEAPVKLQVEESGSITLLKELIQPGQPFDVLHLSAHGDITKVEGKEREQITTVSEPVLLLENEAGDAEVVGVNKLIDTLDRQMPALVFLSACRTAEHGEAYDREFKLAQLSGCTSSVRPSDANEQAAPILADPFARQLCVRVPNVLGWDGSVADIDATAFAATLYEELSRGVSVARAVAIARRRVFSSQFEETNQHPWQGQHWHLARLYVGPGGGGALCDPGSDDTRPTPPDSEIHFLDKTNQRSPVASRAAFVGRRRSIQKVIKAFRDNRRAVLIHGMGNLGKSSLAARVTARMPAHHTVVVFGRCDETSLFSALYKVVTNIAAEIDSLDDGKRLKAEFAICCQEVIEQDAEVGWVLKRLFGKLLKDHPILLILDDLEQSLIEPIAGDQSVEPIQACRATISGVLHAFQTTTRSRLLMTSRYDFTVLDATGQDLTETIVRVPIQSMGAREQEKQWWARVRHDGRGDVVKQVPSELLARMFSAAGGSPGLQDVLTQPLLNGEIEAATAAIEAVERYRQSGTEPTDEGHLSDFFSHMAFEKYRTALNEQEQHALSVTTLFSPSLPVPRTAISTAVIAAGVEKAEVAINRLFSLGLIDDWGARRSTPHMPQYVHAALNPLAKPLSAPLTDEQRSILAEAAVPELVYAWKNEDELLPINECSEEVVRLILQGSRHDPTTLKTLEHATRQAIIYRHQRRQEPPKAFSMVKAVFELFDDTGYQPGADLMFNAIGLAESVGETIWQDALLVRAQTFEDIDERDRILLMGKLADRLCQRGELEAAMRIHVEEVLPVYRTLDEKRAIAVTHGKIADILTLRGEFDEALRILKDEELPIYAVLGDRHSIALTQGRIADIAFQRGDLDKALYIRLNEELPVYTALEDHRSIALTQGGIANILVQRGELGEALSILKNEALPVYSVLGDRRSIAITQGKIADILARRGELDEALHIRREEELPVYRWLGDRRSIAVTLGHIASILTRCGELDEALRIRNYSHLSA